MVLQWQEKGPGPIFGGFNVAIGNYKPQVGAVVTLLADPTNSNNLWVGAANGGIWKSSNATAPVPSWTTSTDNAPSMSIADLDIDPNDTQHLVAGIGRTSSANREGGSLTGILLSEDGGDTWKPVNGNSTIQGRNIYGVSIRGTNIVAASINGGLFLSTDTGNSFTPISGFNTTKFTDIVADPGKSDRLFATSLSGIFESDDNGENWKNISSNLNFTNATNVKLGIYSDKAANNPATVLYAGIVKGGNLAEVARLTNLGDDWKDLDLPQTSETGNASDGSPVGVNPGNQGYIHFSITADSSNANIVYVGGDRQAAPLGDKSTSGANSWTGRLFRGDASQATGKQWTPITNKFANGTAPHADSRMLIMDKDNNLIESDDGGIYKLSSPSGNSLAWTSLIGDQTSQNFSNPSNVVSTIRNTELYSADWDANGKVIIAGAQDNGVSIGYLTIDDPQPNDIYWNEIRGGDGGIVRVDDLSTAKSYQYYSSQSLGGFQRREITYDASGNQVGEPKPVFLNPKVNNTERTLFQYANGTFPFITPIETNKVQSGLLVIGSSDAVYESTDYGNTVTDLFPPGTTPPASTVTAMAYGGKEGGVDKPKVLYVAAGGYLYLRTPDGTTLGQTAYATSSVTKGAAIRDIVLDPNNWQNVYVLTASAVFRSLDQGANWTNITGDLTTNNLSANTLRTIAYVAGATDGLLVGGLGGVYTLKTPNQASQFTWTNFGDNLPNVNVFDLNYDSRDDVLVAGTLGRGAWLANGVKAELAGQAAPPPFKRPPLPTTVTLSVGDAIAPQNLTKLRQLEEEEAGQPLADGEDLPRMTFEVGLNAPSNQTVTVRVTTQDGTAKAERDYVPFDQVLTFAPGETTKEIDIEVIDHAKPGPDKFFSLNLAQSQGATIADGQGIGTIEANLIGYPMLDFNADGNVDFLWRNGAAGENAIWLQEDGTIQQRLFLPQVADANWEIVGTGDFNNDAQSDLVWRNKATGENAIWLLDNNTVLQRAFIPRIADLNWKVVGMGDFNEDGKSDLLWRNMATGEDAIWSMDGTIVSQAQFTRQISDQNWQIVGTGDLNADGKADIVWRNKVTGEDAVWLMDGATVATGALTTQIADTNWQIAGVADYNEDGQADLLWRNTATGENALWFMDGTTLKESQFLKSVSDRNWQVVASADYDNDGMTDILWRNTATGENAVWFMNAENFLDGELLQTVDPGWQAIR